MTAAFTRLTAGNPNILATGRELPDLAALGYLDDEYAASGTAVRYRCADRTADGHWTTEEGEEASFRTRVVVRRPKDAERFSGTLLVEWLNVSSGTDAAPDYVYLADEIIRQGHAWVGVSAQYVSLLGGSTAVDAPAGVTPLRDTDAERYGDLDHPGDAWSYGIYTEVARALRSGTATDGGEAPLAGLDIRQMLAIGESQSGIALTSYVNGVAPHTKAFDGYLVHSRGAIALGLDDEGQGASLTDMADPAITRLRTDLDVPVMVVQAEGDLLAPMYYSLARQPDAERLRVWEIAGSAHADAFMLGAFADMLGLPYRVNRGQMAYVVRAALRHLVDWAAGGPPPPAAPPIELHDDTFGRDQFGIARGGVRTPVTDVPTAQLLGPAPEGSPILTALLGQTLPIEPGLLAERYRDSADYLAQYAAATDSLIEAGFLLADDRDAILAEADPDTVADATGG